MLDSVKIARRQSEIRQNLSALVGKTDLTDDETRSMETMDAEYRTNETRYRAALIAEDSQRREAGEELETRSDREWSEMLGKFELRQVAFALDEGRSLNGATAEIVEELRSAGGYRGIPVPYAALETRAGETVAADQINPKQIRPVIDRIFPGSVAEKLGVQRINIGSGEVAFPVATAGAVFGWQTDELANVGAASEYQTAERSLNPDQTGGAQMVITRKALKQAGEGLEAAIRRDMNAVIGTELDRVVINGSGAAGQPLGIIPGAVTYGITSTAVGAAATWSAFRAEVVAFMEANAITSASMVNLGFDPTIWADLDDTLISGTAVSEWDRLTKHVGTPAITNTIPAETAIMTANVQGVAPGFLEGLLLVHDGAGWIGSTPDVLQNLALLGLGMTADTSNPFSAKLNAALWTAKTLAEGGTGDLFYTMNKEAAGDDLGLTLQTGFITKALLGLFGSDRFRLAVSADGSAFFDGLSVDNATGVVDQPRLPRFKAYTNYDNYLGVGTWTKIAINNTDYNDQGAFDAANNHFVAPVDGTYLFGATLMYKVNASTTARMRGGWC